MKALKPGLRLKSATCETEIMVIKTPPGTEVDICCGGLPMREMSEGGPSSPPEPELMQGTLMGKRYVDGLDTIELLCTKGGEGSLSIDGTPLAPREARALPSSD
jgi:hypothetical protein